MVIHRLEHLSVEQDARGVVTVTFDAGGRRVNVLDQELLSELQSVLDDLETDSSVRLVVFRSGKDSGFLVGADVHHIWNFTTAAEAESMLLRGQSLLQRVEALPAQTLAVIHGPCLGGGLEFALACRHRIARNDSATFLGLPETKLGLIPGWGGTWRLPRAVGLSLAVRMILDGSRVSAGEALRTGLIEAAFEEPDFEEQVTGFIDTLLRNNEQEPVARNRGEGWRDITWLGRKLVLTFARLRVSGRARHNPALSAALRAIAAGVEDGMQAGLVREREEFGGILFDPKCRELLESFFQRGRRAEDD